MLRIRWIFVPLAVLLVFAGCSDDDGGSESDAASDTVEEADDAATSEPEATGETSDPDAAASDDATVDDYVAAMEQTASDDAVAGDVGCFTEGAIDVIGLDTLVDAGVTPEAFANMDSLSDEGIELTIDQRDTLEEAMVECLDDDSVSDLIENASSLSPEPVVACATESFPAESFAHAFVLAISEGETPEATAAFETFQEEMDTVLSDCGG